VSKSQLRDVYWKHDVLVLPSLGDSFGFVALEAMACGLPVIVTENCGVPVPDSAWRVPIMNSTAIARRLEYYASDRDALARDGKIAQVFAKQFTPERYREQIKNLLQKLLA
jgi:glycosyltransferase involved in cell wall biosynthesis